MYRGRTEFIGLHAPFDTLQLSVGQKQAFKCESPADIFPEYYLLRVDEFDKVASTPLDEWISFLKTGVIPQDASAPGLAEARERLRFDHLSDKEKQLYMRDMENIRYQRSVIASGKAEGRAEGIAEGKSQTEIAIAKNMKHLGMDTDTISKLTGLDKETINNL